MPTPPKPPVLPKKKAAASGHKPAPPKGTANGALDELKKRYDELQKKVLLLESEGGTAINKAASKPADAVQSAAKKGASAAISGLTGPVVNLVKEGGKRFLYFSFGIFFLAIWFVRTVF